MHQVLKDVGLIWGLEHLRQSCGPRVLLSTSFELRTQEAVTRYRGVSNAPFRDPVAVRVRVRGESFFNDMTSSPIRSQIGDRLVTSDG